MAKKFLALFFALVLCTMCFAACGQRQTAGESDTEAETTLDPSAEGSEDASGEGEGDESSAEHELPDWSYDLTSHWQECSECSEIVNKGDHTFEEGICTVCACEKLDLTRYDKDGNVAEDGKYIHLGSYPQTLVKGESDEEKEIVNTLNTIAAEHSEEAIPSGWTLLDTNAERSEDIMWYLDVEFGDELYRGVYFSAYRNCISIDGSFGTALPYQKANGYETEKVYWFKFEPITWQILEEKDGVATLLCQSIIDSQDFYSGYSYGVPAGTLTYPNNYQYSTVRTWLNKDFADVAFGGLAAQVICEATVDNSAASTPHESNKYASENTTDRVFLASTADLEKEEFGLSADDAKKKAPTDYAKCMGIEVTNNNSTYWLRSPLDATNSSKSVYTVDSNGQRNQCVVYTFAGVAPAMQITLPE